MLCYPATVKSPSIPLCQRGRQDRSPFWQREARGDFTGGGFTLIELVLTMLILGIIAAVVSQFAFQGIRSYSTEQDRGDVHSQARLAVERMAREIRGVRSPADVTTMNATEFRYTDLGGNRMGFRLNVNNVQRTQDNGGTWQTLATNVTGLTFSYLQTDGTTVAAIPADIWFVRIAITVAQGEVSLPMRVQVHPRNF